MTDVTLVCDPRYILPKENDAYVSDVILEDTLIMDVLKSLGVSVNRVSWDDPAYDWSTSRFTVFRAVWDYFHRYEEFKVWMAKTSRKTEFINHVKLIDWNIDKHYFLELEDKGVHLPKTRIFDPNSVYDLDKAMKMAKEEKGFESEEWILKPCVAGGARHTYKFHQDDWKRHQEIFAKLMHSEAMMLQEFQKNIVSQGEVSIMVMDGQFTHAILKKAKSGDFRVQNDYGGTIELYDPTKEEIDFALYTVAQSPIEPLYARVDIFNDNDNKIALAELEVFEPELWFRSYPKAAEVLAQGIYKKVKGA